MTNLDPRASVASRLVEWMLRELFEFGERLAFWLGIGLPICYLPLIVGGFVNVDFSTFIALIVANYIALLAGAGHGRPPPTEDRGGSPLDGS